MNKSILSFTILTFIGALFFWSCKKESTGIGNNGNGGGGNTQIIDSFSIVYTDNGNFPANAQQIFDLAPVGFKAQAYSGKFASNIDAELGQNGTSREKVLSIKGKSLLVSITNNPGQNFDFMDSIWVYVKKADGTGNDILFGYKYNYPLGQRILNLDMTDAEVKDVFNADSVQLTLFGTKRAGSHTIMPNTNVEFKSTIKGIFDITP